MYGRGHAQGYGNTRARGRGRSYGNGNSKVIDLPDGISPGVIIGPGADNLKWLKRETGVSRINVTDHGITINGHPSAISAAERLLNGQIQALLNQAGPNSGLLLRLLHAFSRFSAADIMHMCMYASGAA